MNDEDKINNILKQLGITDVMCNGLILGNCEPVETNVIRYH